MLVRVTAGLSLGLADQALYFVQRRRAYQAALVSGRHLTAPIFRIWLARCDLTIGINVSMVAALIISSLA